MGGAAVTPDNTPVPVVEFQSFATLLRFSEWMAKRHSNWTRVHELIGTLTIGVRPAALKEWREIIVRKLIYGDWKPKQPNDPA